ncbi:low specificity L-threonine aldolase [Amaricoccus sp.]|uniref:threonine aldolase family protein n=1 Tax=Amaricoccus sp. TaxID=1872485 RepID=UPI001B4CFE23|nr:beta-eliminating lyase-related protein [Amaricoccus sp.]MBP7000068.1 low specificity L-threonine aldolase [Amaricoccus sp.]
MWFLSDNAGPAHPSVLDALARANAGHAAGYGDDAVTARVVARIREIFEAPEAAVRLVATGSAANVLTLACLCPPWGTVFCHTHAHVQEDECGALGFYAGGATTTPVEGAHGRIDPAALAAAIARAGGSVHQVQPGAVTLTNATEAGAVYDPDAVARLAAVARAAGLPVHMDGARFANAVASLGCAPAELTWKAGVDALSFGGTKNGLMGVEAVILFDPARAWELELRRKRAGHLFSKHRFLAAQMEAYLADGLWLDLAGRANAAAARLSAGVAAIPGARIEHPTEANEVFAAWPRAGHRRARAAGAQYYLWSFDDPAAATLDGPDDVLVPARLVCDWSADPAAIDRFVALARGEEVAQRA